jgi:hypothetical protein
MTMRKVTAAAVQATPVFLDRDATIERSEKLIHEAATNGAGLMVFPETFIPGYPDWVWRVPAWEGPSGELYERLLDNAVVVPGPATEAIGRAAKRAKAFVSIGVNEREQTGSTLYNTQLYFGPDGRLLAKHRKLMPTGGERLVWGMGDGSTLEVVETPFGRLGRADLLGELHAPRPVRHVRQGHRRLVRAHVGQQRRVDIDPSPHRTRGSRLRDRRRSAAARLRRSGRRAWQAGRVGRRR